MAAFGRQLAMHVAAAKPKYLAKEDVPAEKVAEEREIVMTRMADIVAWSAPRSEFLGKHAQRTALEETRS